MATFTPVNTSGFPVNVLDLKHDDFYDFVELQYGPLQANILRLQLISDASIFVECANPTEIMTYNSEKLDDLKNESCLMTTDGSFIVLPGITASFSSLKKQLLKKIEEVIKKSRRDGNISNASTPSTQPLANGIKSIDELKAHIIKSIDQWTEKYRTDFDFQANSVLVEAIDYHIQFIDNGTNEQSVVIKCACGTKSSIGRHGTNGHFTLSNFYRHLERRSCSTMIGKLNKQVNLDNNGGHLNSSSQISQSSPTLPSSSLPLYNLPNDGHRKRVTSTKMSTVSQAVKRRRT